MFSLLVVVLDQHQQWEQQLCVGRKYFVVFGGEFTATTLWGQVELLQGTLIDRWPVSQVDGWMDVFAAEIEPQDRDKPAWTSSARREQKSKSKQVYGSRNKSRNSCRVVECCFGCCCCKSLRVWLTKAGLIFGPLGASCWLADASSSLRPSWLLRRSANPMIDCSTLSPTSRH